MTDKPQRRRLGSLSLGALVAANMIGAGVFTTSGFALADLGSPSRVMWVWVAGGALALLGVLCYGALAARLPESGGEYLFLSRTLHPGLGFLAGWVSIWAGFTGAIALAAEAAQAYLLPWLPASMPADLVGSSLIVAAGFLHTRGLRSGALLQNVIVVAKVGLLIALIALGVSGAAPLPASTPVAFSLGTFTTTMMWVSLSYSGWNAAVYIGGEAAVPERSLPRSMLGATVVVTALYLALNWIFVYSAPIEELAGQEDVAALAARAIGGSVLEALVRLILVVSLVTSVSAMVMIGPRVIARMADDGLLPARLAFRGSVPSAAIWTQVALSVGILWASGLREQLTNLGWVLSLFTALTVLGLLRLRAREGSEQVRIPGYPFVPVTFLVLVFGLTGTMVIVNGSELVPAIALLASGALAWALSARSSEGP